jgi:hypothetical protein
MSVTLDVSHDPISWLNLSAFWNIPLMSVTLDVSQDPMS